MTVRALLSALLLGGAVVGSRLLAGPLTAPSQDAAVTELQVAPEQQDQTHTGAQHRPIHKLAGTQPSIHGGVASAEAVRAARYGS
jgi:hypothetical protein